MDDLRVQLLGRDYLYEDAGAYRAGVEAAFAALEAGMQAGAPTVAVAWDSATQ